MRKPATLRGQVMLLLSVPLVLLLLIETIVSYALSLNVANAVFDTWLLDAANSIAQEVRVGDAGPRFIADSSAIEVFEWDSLDATYFRISDAAGRPLAGDLPIQTRVDRRRLLQAPVFTDVSQPGADLRGVSLLKWPDSDKEVLVEVYETLNKRRAMATPVLGAVLAKKLLFMALALILVYLALGRGLRPLTHLARDVRNRSPRDLAPLMPGPEPRELQALVNSMNSLLLRISDAISSREEFIGNIAHQIRTPLAGIKLQAELGQREDDPDAMRENFQRIADSADGMSRVNYQLLLLARAEMALDRGIRAGLTDIVSIARQCCLELGPRAAEKDISLSLDSPGVPVRVAGEGTLLAEMLRNLLDNAIRYGRPGGQVTLSFEVGEQRLRLLVDDDGPGIPTEHKARIFERFHRVPGSSAGGCGLGLAITRDIARAHGAQLLLAEPPSGTGTRFIVDFSVDPQGPL